MQFQYLPVLDIDEREVDFVSGTQLITEPKYTLNTTPAARLGQGLAGWARQAQHLLGPQSVIYMLVNPHYETSDAAWIETSAYGENVMQYVITGRVSSNLDLVHLPLRQVTTTSTTSVEATFATLADEWISDTAFESNITAIFTHEKYLQIVGMGPAAIPFLLERLPIEPERWVGALRFITRLPIASDAPSADDAVATWRQWGRTEGYLAD